MTMDFPPHLPLDGTTEAVYIGSEATDGDGAPRSWVGAIGEGKSSIPARTPRQGESAASRDNDRKP